MEKTVPSAASSPPQAARLDLRFVDGLRAVAALLVVLHHACCTAYPSGADTAPVWTRCLWSGHTVPVFMVISGFCLMLPIVRGDGTLRGGAGTFFLKRARRIAPPYYFAIGFSLALDFLCLGPPVGRLHPGIPVGRFWDYTLPVTWHSLGIHLLLLQNFFGGEIFSINYAFWSLSLEAAIYLLFPGLVWVWKRLGAIATAASMLVLTFTLHKVCERVLHNGFMLHFVGLFALGMLAAEVAYTQNPALCRLRGRLPWSALSGIAAVLLALAMTGRIRHFSSSGLIDLLVAVLTLCLLVTVTVQPQCWAGRLLSSRNLVFIGGFAYSIYLVHAPLLQFLWQFVFLRLHFSHSAAYLLLVGTGIPLVVLLSFVFFFFCERPFTAKYARLPVKTASNRSAA